MAKSMTAFARVELNNISWEIRSVNQRYLDVSFRMPEPYRSTEITLKNSLRQQVHRGKIDCSLWVSKEIIQTSLSVDDQLVASLLSATKQINQITGFGHDIDAMEILRWPGVIVDKEPDSGDERDDITQAFKDGIQMLVDMRQREGDELKNIVLAQLGELKKIVDSVRAEVPAISLQQQQKLQNRLAKIKVEVDVGRLEQELVYMAQKSDIAEELDRLDTLVEEVKHTLEQANPIGRRLDFLMQELNREANTLSSKATVSNTSLQAVDLKVLIEQMREQVQNIE
jgi:uncharacterized protein (TIGR00255 family)